MEKVEEHLPNKGVLYVKKAQGKEGWDQSSQHEKLQK